MSRREVRNDGARRLKAYPAYKASGVEWLGEIPKHWEVWRLGGLGFAGSRYVELALATARVRLGLVAESEPRCTLESLGADLRVPVHIRWSAIRWLAHLLAQIGEEGDRDVGLRSLTAAAAAESAPQRTARTRLALVKLDSALRQQRTAAADAALRELEALDPGPVGHLSAAAQRARHDASEYVARFYPY